MFLLLLLSCARTPEQVTAACNDYCNALDSCAEAAPAYRWDACVGWCQADHAAADFVACMDQTDTDSTAPTGEARNPVVDACRADTLPPDMAE